MINYPERDDKHFHNPWEEDAEYCAFCDAELGYMRDDAGRLMPWCVVCEEQYENEC